MPLRVCERTPRTYIVVRRDYYNYVTTNDRNARVPNAASQDNSTASGVDDAGDTVDNAADDNDTPVKRARNIGVFHNRHLVCRELHRRMQHVESAQTTRTVTHTHAAGPKRTRL